MANERSAPGPNEVAESTVEEVLRAFQELLSPEELEESRDLLRDVVAAHPLGRLLAERVRERSPSDQSREQPTGGRGLNVEAPKTEDADEGSRQKGKATGERR